jgi:peptide/nickel transport system permease protein
VLGPGLQNVILTLAFTTWVTYARVVRGQVLSLREKEFITAARCIGVGDVATMVRHILPNTLAPVIVIASFAVANTMLAEAALSFLGLDKYQSGFMRERLKRWTTISVTKIITL